MGSDTASPPFRARDWLRSCKAVANIASNASKKLLVLLVAYSLAALLNIVNFCIRRGNFTFLHYRCVPWPA